MSEGITPELFARLESLYPQPQEGEISPWSFVAATAFSASNLPEAVPLVFQYASKDLKSDEHRLLLARKLKDAIFKSGLLSGFPKAINALAKLHTALPESLRDVKALRDVSMSTEELHRIGQEHFTRTYGETADSVQAFLREISPDFEHFSTTFAYGYTYSFSQVLTAADTSFAMVAALIASDTPPQIEWHLRGAMRNGASRVEVIAVRDISIEVAKVAGVVWKNQIPEVPT
ncbi:AhpD-like protein [Crucibulum laeve]|uniref:AhpD-like protein n=1 Tax=Crucibulum laeve TaxID=68775 RepID=A0A5C3LZ10_9AGAR|nr:AhpD-like protein [Crucibulum laeve]